MIQEQVASHGACWLSPAVSALALVLLLVTLLPVAGVAAHASDAHANMPHMGSGAAIGLLGVEPPPVRLAAGSRRPVSALAAVARPRGRIDREPLDHPPRVSPPV